MQKLSLRLNFIFTCALVTALLLTWLAPKVIGILFTPPVSFGINCEPAADWAMSKVIWTQIIGLVMGAIGATIWLLLPGDKSKSSPVDKPSGA